MALERKGGVLPLQPSPAELCSLMRGLLTAIPQSARGHWLERYSIDYSHSFGYGGYGTTYAATDMLTGEKLAAKVVDLTKMSLVAIRNECRALELLRGHSSVIALRAHGLGRSGGAAGSEDGAGKSDRYVIVMERAPGGELFDHIGNHKQPMPESRARPLGLQVIAAIEHCHRQGIAHRDVKLENLLLSADGQAVKLIDFGLCHLYSCDSHGRLDCSRPVRGFCGSSTYAAPEVIRGGEYDALAADMWSLGVCLFGMLNGFLPVDRAAPGDWRYDRMLKAQGSKSGRWSVVQILSWYRKSATHMSVEAVALLDQLLQIDPTRRPSAADVCNHPWVVTRVPWAIKPAELPAPRADATRRREASPSPTGATESVSSGSEVEVDATGRSVPLATCGGDATALAKAPGPRAPPVVVGELGAGSLIGAAMMRCLCGPVH